MKIKNLFVFDEYMRIFVLGFIMIYTSGFFKFTYLLIFGEIEIWQYLASIFGMPFLILFGLRVYQAMCRFLGVNKRYENFKSKLYNKKQKNNTTIRKNINNSN